MPHLNQRLILRYISYTGTAILAINYTIFLDSDNVKTGVYSEVVLRITSFDQLRF